MREEVLRLAEEEIATPKGLVGIGVFAAVAFLFMAFVSDPRLRPMPLVIGGGIVAALLLSAAWQLRARRYGEATLIAVTPFAFGSRFEGWIDSEMPAVPDKPLRVLIFGFNSAGRMLTTRVEVPPQRIERTAAGTIRIPFSIDVPDTERARSSTGVRLVVRTKRWPLDWGATFLVVAPSLF